MENQRTGIYSSRWLWTIRKSSESKNGYYERDFTTRVGTLELKVPRTRDGEFAPTVFERYQRNEKALLASMLEMYVSGVSTRKVSKIVEELCGKSVSKSFVSSLTEQLDPMVKEWQNRSLSGTNYPYLMTDVLYIKSARTIECFLKLPYCDRDNRRWWSWNHWLHDPKWRKWWHMVHLLWLLKRTRSTGGQNSSFLMPIKA